MRRFTVRCGQELADALRDRVAHHREAEIAWWRQRRAELPAAGACSAAERAQLADQLQAQFEAARAAGQLRGSVSAAVTPALRHVMDEFGWTGRRFKPVPPRRAGRPWGTHDAGFDTRVTVDLPDDLGEHMARACYWTSQPAVAQLQAWYDRHGDHWRGQLHKHGMVWAGRGPSHAEMSERDNLVAQIHTTGQVLRRAIHQATA